MGDMRWSNQDLEKRHDAHLAHIYGNLVNRALKLSKKMFPQSCVPDVDVYADIFDLNQLIIETEDAFKNYDLSGAAEQCLNSLRKVNDWITKKEPWKLPKSETKKKQKIIRSVLE